MAEEEKPEEVEETKEEEPKEEEPKEKEAPVEEAKEETVEEAEPKEEPKEEEAKEEKVEEAEPVEEPKEEPKEEEPKEEVKEAPEEVEEKPVKKKKEKKKKPKKGKKEEGGPKIFAIRTTANREEQVMDFLAANAEKKGLEIYAVIRPHGMRSYIFVEATNRMEAEQAAFDVPYARGVLPDPVPYEEIEHMVEQIKKEVNIQKNDIVEIISGPFKREKAKVTKIDKDKEEVVVELLEAAVPIPITLKLDALKVIRREEE